MVGENAGSQGCASGHSRGRWSFEQTDHSRMKFAFGGDSGSNLTTSGSKDLYYTDPRNFGTLTFSLDDAELRRKLASIGPSYLLGEVTAIEFLRLGGFLSALSFLALANCVSLAKFVVTFLRLSFPSLSLSLSLSLPLSLSPSLPLPLSLSLSDSLLVFLFRRVSFFCVLFLPLSFLLDPPFPFPLRLPI